MSRIRLASTTAVLVIVIGAAAVGAARTLPFDVRTLAAPVASQSDVANSKDPDVTLPVAVSTVKPQYTQAAKDAKIQGDVLLSVVVQKDGTVGDVTVTKSLDRQYGLDDEAVKATKQWRFKPGTKKGTPVAVRVEMQMKFTLK